jgi:hypothetical protein
LKGASLRIWPRQEGPAACLTVSPHSPRKKQVVASFSSSTVDYKWVYNMDLLKEPPKKTKIFPIDYPRSGFPMEKIKNHLQQIQDKERIDNHLVVFVRKQAM